MSRGALRAHRAGKRSQSAIDAQFRTSSGPMGGTKRIKNRQDRQNVKNNLKNGNWYEII